MRYGLDSKLWQNDFEVSKSYKGDYTASQSFICAWSDLASALPEFKTACPNEGFTDLYVGSVSIKQEPDGGAKVTVGYIGNVLGDNSTIDNLPVGYQTKISCQVTEESLCTHENYKDISADRKGEILKLCNGGAKLDGDILKMLDGSKIAGTEDSQVTLTGLEKELAQKIAGAGEINYLAPKLVYTVSWYSDLPMNGSLISNIGTVCDPIGSAPSVTDHNWLCIGVDSDYNGVYYVNSVTYWLGIWDLDLY